jgi:hypothetical protein
LKIFSPKGYGMTQDEFCEVLLEAFSLSGERVREDDVMRHMSVAASSFVAGLNRCVDPISQRLALSAFLMGFMAHEEGWADLELWRTDGEGK